MTITRLFPAVVCAALLTACAGPGTTPVNPQASMASVLTDADAAAKSGRQDQAYAMLKSAAASAPRDKTPLLRMAQMYFDDKNYGEAIVNGLQALERDPNDILAYSLVAVSGLRVSSKALGDLSAKNGFTGSVRSEAQDLAALLRNTLKEPIVASGSGPGPRAASRPATPAAAPAQAPVKAPGATAATGKVCSGPFCGLN